MYRWIFVWVGLLLASPHCVTAAEGDAEGTDTTPQQTNSDASATKPADSATSKDESTKTDKASEESGGESEPDCE